MNRIDAAFSRLRRQRKKALIVYLTVGYPSLAALPEIVKILAEEGVDLVELGVPFSDPLADGPTIQAASQRALQNGVTPRRVFRSVEALRKRGIQLPVALMTYYNPISRYGVTDFCRQCRVSGVDGVIVPDLPPEEAAELVRAARPAGIKTIFLAAPTSPAARLKRIAKISTGFIYYVSLTGVTGARASLPAQVSSQVRSIRRLTRMPVCVGFGISRPDQVSDLARVADGVIVGSALLNVIDRAGKNRVRAVRGFIRRLRSACHG